MKHHESRRTVRLLHAGVLLLISAVGTAALADDSAKGTPPPASGASLLGGALPGGAILSAAFAQVTPAAGGRTVTVAIAPDGSFRATGLKPGSYQVAFTSTPKQTQGASFGEKVQGGMQQAGSAIASGATGTQTAAPQPAAASAAAQPQQTQRRIDSTPARISTNFTVGKQTGRAVVDGPAVLVEVGADGVLAGQASPSTPE